MPVLKLTFFGFLSLPINPGLYEASCKGFSDVRNYLLINHFCVDPTFFEGQRVPPLLNFFYLSIYPSFLLKNFFWTIGFRVSFSV
jgi:hypothetical protein